MHDARPPLIWFFRCWPIVAPTVVLVAALFAVIATMFMTPARALPSFARQTGQPCGACHTDFAGLTPYGRRFKINGYTNGGGQYRTTLFPFDEFDRQTKAVGATDLDDGGSRLHSYGNG